MLLHAQRLWPEYISTMLWPFALLVAADRINNMNVDINGLTPEIKFSQVAGPTVRLQSYHTFGCPELKRLWMTVDLSQLLMFQCLMSRLVIRRAPC